MAKTFEEWWAQTKHPFSHIDDARCGWHARDAEVSALEAEIADLERQLAEQDAEWIKAFGAKDLRPRVTPQSLAKWVFRDVEQQLHRLKLESAARMHIATPDDCCALDAYVQEKVASHNRSCWCPTCHEPAEHDALIGELKLEIHCLNKALVEARKELEGVQEKVAEAVLAESEWWLTFVETNTFGCVEGGHEAVRNRIGANRRAAQHPSGEASKKA